MEKMKATVFRGKDDIRVNEVIRPHPESGEAVIRVTLTTICGIPTLGLPCPITIFTVGLLMWSKPPTPVRVVIIPLVWCALGLTSTVTLSMYEDSLLLLGILSGGGLLLAAEQANSWQIISGRHSSL